MKQRARIAIPLILVAATAIWYVTRSTEPGDGALFASGTVEATTADLGFQLPGRIETLVVGEGQVVSGGEELARLDTRELAAAREAAAAVVDASGARLSEMRSGARPQEIATAEAAERAAQRRVVNARAEAERAERLYAGGAISRQAYDAALTALDLALAGYDQAVQALALVREGPRAEAIGAQRALVGQAEANLASVDARLANAILSAPFPGVVTVKHRQPGEIVGAGAPVVTLLDPDDRWVRIYVPEDRIGRVRIGQQAVIVSDTYPDRSYSGEVVFIGSEAEFTPRNVQTAEERTKLVYPVKVRITGDPEFVLKPGIPADVTLTENGA